MQVPCAEWSLEIALLNAGWFPVLISNYKSYTGEIIYFQRLEVFSYTLFSFFLLYITNLKILTLVYYSQIARPFFENTFEIHAFAYIYEIPNRTPDFVLDLYSVLPSSVIAAATAIIWIKKKWVDFKIGFIIYFNNAQQSFLYLYSL